MSMHWMCRYRETSQWPPQPLVHGRTSYRPRPVRSTSLRSGARASLSAGMHTRPLSQTSSLQRPLLSESPLGNVLVYSHLLSLSPTIVHTSDYSYDLPLRTIIDPRQLHQQHKISFLFLRELFTHWLRVWLFHLCRHCFLHPAVYFRLQEYGRNKYIQNVCSMRPKRQKGPYSKKRTNNFSGYILTNNRPYFLKICEYNGYLEL